MLYERTALYVNSNPISSPASAPLAARELTTNSGNATVLASCVRTRAETATVLSGRQINPVRGLQR
jgi:hypothetical protein